MPAASSSVTAPSSRTSCGVNPMLSVMTMARYQGLRIAAEFDDMRVDAPAAIRLVARADDRTPGAPALFGRHTYRCDRGLRSTDVVSTGFLVIRPTEEGKESGDSASTGLRSRTEWRRQRKRRENDRTDHRGDAVECTQ